MMLAKINFSRSQSYYKYIPQLRKYCQDSHSKDGEGKNVSDRQKKAMDEEKKVEAQKKMKELLQSITKTSHVSSEPVKLSRPPKYKKKSANMMKKKVSDVGDIDFKMKKAVKEVADSLTGDPKETESELLSALRSQSGSKQNLSDIVSGMKVIHQKQHSEDFTERDASVRNVTESESPKSKLHLYRSSLREGERSLGYKNEKPIELFGLPPLGVFPPESNTWKDSETSNLSTWDASLEREKWITVNHGPRNYFEEQIKWTEEGKLWTFPVDNEFGLLEEKQVSFADHIFLERHLHGWCPSKGPIRHFMELVCVGLSKNPWVSAERKKAHIYWFKEYFESKQELLREVGAM